jgi:hypothetical protein
MTLHPRRPADLALAPVAAGIDQNLQRFRDKSPDDIDYELALELDSMPFPDTRDQRAEHVLRAALRNIDAHGWHGSITDDSARLRLVGGSVTLDVGLGESVMRYITSGV